MPLTWLLASFVEALGSIRSALLNGLPPPLLTCVVEKEWQLLAIHSLSFHFPPVVMVVLIIWVSVLQPFKVVLFL